jgi:hypothetical protein
VRWLYFAVPVEVGGGGGHGAQWRASHGWRQGGEEWWGEGGGRGFSQPFITSFATPTNAFATLRPNDAIASKSDRFTSFRAARHSSTISLIQETASFKSSCVSLKCVK